LKIIHYSLSSDFLLVHSLVFKTEIYIEKLQITITHLDFFHCSNTRNNRKDLVLPCNFSFPLSQADALIVEVQDSKKAVHGEARIPISSLSDNPV